MSPYIRDQLMAGSSPPHNESLTASHGTSYQGEGTHALRLRPSRAFDDELNRPFLIALKQLHLQRLSGRDALDTTCWISGRRVSNNAERVHGDDAWTRWLGPLHAWATQFCFLPADYRDWGVRMSMHVNEVENVAISIQFVLSNLSCDAERSTARDWFDDYLGQDGPDLRFDLASHKECMCIVFRTAEDILDWDELSGDLTIPTNAGSTTQRMLALFVQRCNKACCAYAIITDGIRSLFMSIDEPKGRDIQDLWSQVITAAEHSVVYLVAAVLYRFSWSLQPREFLRSFGAVNRAGSDAYNDQADGFRDFDLYTMVRDRALFLRFLDWKQRAAIAAMEHLVRPGTTLAVNRHVLPGRYLPWQNPHPKCAVGPDTAQATACQRRPVQADVWELLKIAEPLMFEIQEVKQCGPDKFSQVAFGTLKLAGGLAASRPLCLKLYDEVFFPVPDLAEYDDTPSPNLKLAALNHADEMLRREEAAYARLAEHQGSLIPHFYGCHEFLVSNHSDDKPRVRKVLGILLEVIDGLRLGDLRAGICGDWQDVERRRLYQRLRQLARVLNHAGVSQGDWHMNQIMCLTRPSHASSNRADSMDLVLIDFAFATQDLGRFARLNEINDVGSLGGVAFGLGMTSSIAEEIGWFERDECEE